MTLIRIRNSWLALVVVLPIALIFGIGCEGADFSRKNSKKSQNDGPGGANGATPAGGDPYASGATPGGTGADGTTPYGPNGAGGPNGFGGPSGGPGGFGNPNGNLGFPGNNPNGLGGFGGDTPIVLDWDRDGAISMNSAQVRFDVDGDGRSELTEWVKPNDRILALDMNGNGQIDSGRELFGNAHVLLRNLRPAKHGFAALAAWDNNYDKKIDKQDKVFARLVVWQDRNQNGVSEKNELTKLSKTDVTSLTLSYDPVPLGQGLMQGSLSRIGLKATYTTNKKEHLLADVYFHVTRNNKLAAIEKNQGKAVNHD